MGAEHPIMQENLPNLPVERLVRKALRAEEPIGRPGIRQLGIPQGAKRLEERWS
jgi:histone H3/H4